MAVRIGNKIIIGGGLTLFCAALLWISTVSQATSFWVLAAQMIVFGTGMGLTQAPATDNPDGWDPAMLDANYTAVAANVPQWCADFEAAGPHFGSSPGSSPGLVDWTTRMIVETPLCVLLTHRLLSSSPGERPRPSSTAPNSPSTRAPEHGLYASDHRALNTDIVAFINNRVA